MKSEKCRGKQGKRCHNDEIILIILCINYKKRGAECKDGGGGRGRKNCGILQKKKMRAAEMSRTGQRDWIKNKRPGVTDAGPQTVEKPRRVSLRSGERK